MKHGIDISKWQGTAKTDKNPAGTVDWNKLSAEHRAGRLDFVILRAGYGGCTVDPTFEANYAAARAAGIPVGAYWYAYWGSYTPVQEAAGFLAAVAGKVLEMGVWYDVEYETSITTLSKAERTAKTLEGLAALAASGRYVGLYASTDMLNNRMDYDRLRDYDVWVAQYGSLCTCKLPYGIWQYTSTGRVEGIAGNVDRDRAYKDYPAFVVGKLAGAAADMVDKPGQTGIVDKPGQGGTPAAPDLDSGRLPREVQTWRITGADKPRCDRLIGLCDTLGLYIMGSVALQLEHAHGPDELVELAIRLELLAGSSLHIGPMTRGDLIQVLEAAGRTGLPLQATLEIGPVSSGDSVALQALAKELGLPCEEVG